MGTPWWMTDRFQTLKAEWDRRLEEDGFNDIEREDGSLRKDKSKWLLKHNPVLADRIGFSWIGCFHCSLLPCQ